MLVATTLVVSAILIGTASWLADRLPNLAGFLPQRSLTAWLFSARA